MKIKQKFPYNIHRSLIKILSLSLVMGATVACNKVTEPEPWREITIPWTWASGEGLAPRKDTIAFYANDPTVKYVYIYLRPFDTYGTTLEQEHFRIGRDTLQTRIDINPDKVRGRGVIRVGSDGAHIHPDTLTKKYGMWETDSLWFASHGWRIERYTPHSR